MQIEQKPDGQVVLKVLSGAVADMKLWGEEVGGRLTFLRSCLGGYTRGWAWELLEGGSHDRNFLRSLNGPRGSYAFFHAAPERWFCTAWVQLALIFCTLQPY